MWSFGFARFIATTFAVNGPRFVLIFHKRQDEFGVATDVGVVTVIAAAFGACATIKNVVMANSIKVFLMYA
jgi:hypothetical protein